MIYIREEYKKYNYYHRIQEHEVKEVLKQMSNNKAVGLEYRYLLKYEKFFGKFRPQT